MTINNCIPTSMKAIGETDRCPYCNKEMRTIPSRLKKCPYCGDNIYVRTRPQDRKKILVRENQRENVEREWRKYSEEREWNLLIQTTEYQTRARVEQQKLKEELEREPTLIELKLSVVNTQMREYAAKRQWGLYRNCKLTIAQTLENQGYVKDALTTIFEVSYLDINGPNNVMTINGQAMSYTESEKRGITDFTPRVAFIAPAVITWIQKWRTSLNLSEVDAKALFIQTNTNNKPVNEMPIPPHEAWERLRKQIDESKRIDAIDVSDYLKVTREIEQLIEQNEMNEVKKTARKNQITIQEKKIPNRKRGTGKIICNEAYAIKKQTSVKPRRSINGYVSEKR